MAAEEEPARLVHRWRDRLGTVDMGRGHRWQPRRTPWDSVRFRPSQRKQRLGSRTLAKLHGVVAAVVGGCALAPAAREAGSDNAYIVASAVAVTAAGRFSVGATLQARAGPSVKRLYKDREPRPWP